MNNFVKNNETEGNTKTIENQQKELRWSNIFQFHYDIIMEISDSVCDNKEVQQAVRVYKYRRIMQAIRYFAPEDAARIQALARTMSTNRGTKAVGTTGNKNLDLTTEQLQQKAFRVYKSTCERAANGLQKAADIIKDATRAELIKCWDGAGMKPASVIRLVASKQQKKSKKAAKKGAKNGNK